MRRVLIFFLLVLFFIASIAWAEDTINNDNSVQYVIDVGDGITVVIFGDSNSVIVGESLTEDKEPILNKIFVRGESVYEITGPTEVEVDGVFTIYTRIIKRYNGNTFEVVWAEQ